MKRVCRKEADAGTKVLDPQGVSRLAPRQQPGQGGYRLNGEVHKVYKKYHSARGKPVSVQREVRARYEHAKLGKYGGYYAYHADYRHYTFPPELFLFKRAVAAGKKLKYLLLRLKAFHHGKAGKAIAEGSGKVAVAVGHSAFGSLQPAARK